MVMSPIVHEVTSTWQSCALTILLRFCALLFDALYLNPIQPYNTVTHKDAFKIRMRVEVNVFILLRRVVIYLLNICL